MGRETATPPTVLLTRAQPQEDGSHSSHRLSEAQRRGEMLRVRTGAYVRSTDWVTSPPWLRYALTTAAAAMTNPSTLFCREAALLLHGLPLLHSPHAVTARTRSYNHAGTHASPALHGRLSFATFRDRYMRRHPEAAPPRPQDVHGIPTKLFEAAIPPGSTRTSLRSAVRSDSFSPPRIVLPRETLAGIAGPDGYRVEPLGLALVDTIPRMTFAEAVVLLDAAKARDDVELAPWLPYLRTRRQRHLWERAWAFADPLAESPLESEARTVLHHLGFPAPTLQQKVQTRRGIFRLDLSWPEAKVALEVDGRVKYFDDAFMAGRDAREVHYREKLRREALEEEGWTIVRVGQAELRDGQAMLRRLAVAGILPMRPALTIA